MPDETPTEPRVDLSGARTAAIVSAVFLGICLLTGSYNWSAIGEMLRHGPTVTVTEVTIPPASETPAPPRVAR